jgi:hypothetical protein
VAQAFAAKLFDQSHKRLARVEVFFAWRGRLQGVDEMVKPHLDGFLCGLVSQEVYFQL